MKDAKTAREEEMTAARLASKGEEEVNDWDERFAAWANELGADEPISIYAYTVERLGGQAKRRQEYVWRFSADDDEYPSTHDMGLILGSGDFDIIARAKGEKMFQKKIYLGPAYDRLRDEANGAGQAAAAAPAAAPAPAAAALDLGGLVDLAKPFLPALGKFLMEMFNPMARFESMAKMGETMAARQYETTVAMADKAASQIVKNAADRATAMGPQVPATAAAAVEDPKAGGVDWEEKMSFLVDLFLEKGESFLNAGPVKKEFMKKKILKDDDFQELLGDRAGMARTLGRLYKEVGVTKVNRVLKELGIEPPVMAPGAAAKPAATQRPAAAAKAGKQGRRV